MVCRCPQHVRQQQWQTDGNFWQYNLSTTHFTLQSFVCCSFLVPLWLICLTLHMLPLRQEQLTAFLTLPPVSKMAQSKKIRVCIWGGGCFCASVQMHRWNIHEVVWFFLANLCQKRRKMQQLGWVDALAVMLLEKNKAGGVERGIWGSDSLQSATMCPKLKSQPMFFLNTTRWRYTLLLNSQMPKKISCP